MGICASCYEITNNDNEQHYKEEEEDKLDQGKEEDSQDVLVHHDQLVLHDQPVHHHDHFHFHQQPKGRKSMCRRCNLRLLTLIHVPPKEDTAVAVVEEDARKEKFEDSQQQQDERSLGSTPSTLPPSGKSSQISRADDGDTSDKIEDAGIANSEFSRKSRKPHRDLHVSWRKGHGDFIDHLMFGWHH